MLELDIMELTESRVLLRLGLADAAARRSTRSPRSPPRSRYCDST